jgi:hypothetical protein
MDKRTVRNNLGYEPSNSVFESLVSRTVPYFPELARALGSIHSALFLRQCVYWQARNVHPDGYWYKTIAEFEQELAMSRWEQETCIKILVEHKLLYKKVMGCPKKRYFYCDTEAVDDFIKRYNQKIQQEKDKADKESASVAKR